MKTIARLIMLAGLSGAALAADLEAGRIKAETVCAACHGSNGVSVSDSIPNLAAQRASYLESQLKALRDGTRKNALMNAIAAQLSAEDIANVAAYFSAQAGATGTAKSSLLANITRTQVSFPTDYKTSFVKYHSINFPATKRVQHFYANASALKAAKSGLPLPDGAVLFSEAFAARLDESGKPLNGDDGFYLADKLLFYTAMARNTGWGKDIPEMLRNSDWNYAVFTPDKQLRPAVNQAECLACHKPKDATSFVFTYAQLGAAH